MGCRGHKEGVPDLEQLVDLGGRAIEVASGPTGRVCALMSDRTVRCWGSRDLSAGLKPSPVDGLENATAIAVGESFACAVVSGGDVECWGDDNDRGQLGREPFEGQTGAERVVGPSDVREIAAGTVTACALTNNDEVWCWGSITDPSTGWQPTRVQGLDAVSS